MAPISQDLEPPTNPGRFRYVCPAGADLPTNRRLRDDDTYAYYSSVNDCRACALKSQCCPKSPERKITRSVHEAARDVARAIAKTEAYEVSRRLRKKVEMQFAHLKRILRLNGFGCEGQTAPSSSS